MDAWAVGLVGLVLWTRQVPTHSQSGFNKKNSHLDGSAFALTAASQILPPITEESWPSHSTLPRWHQYSGRLIGPPSQHEALLGFVKENQLQPYSECRPEITASLVKMGFRWNPEARESMEVMKSFLLENFTFQAKKEKKKINAAKKKKKNQKKRR